MFNNFAIRIADFENIKSSSKPYSGDEKTGLHSLITKNKNIIDIEIAFASEEFEEPDYTEFEYDDETGIRPKGKKKRTTPRIDLAAFCRGNDGIELVFFEAKTFNNPEGKTKGKNLPRVVQQINQYEKLLKKHQKEIKNSFTLMLDNLVELRGKKFFPKEVVDIIENNNEFSVNTTPYLIIFGFGKDDKNGEYGKKHLKKLENHYKNRFISKGNPAGIVLSKLRK